jgi:hypothetical protein
MIARSSDREREQLHVVVEVKLEAVIQTMSPDAPETRCLTTAVATVVGATLL